MAFNWFRRKKKEDAQPEPSVQEEQTSEVTEIPQAPEETALPETETPEADTPEPASPESEPPKERFFRRVRKGMSKTRRAFTGRIEGLLAGKKEIDEALLEELEEILITSDIGVQTTAALIEKMREKAQAGELADPGELHDGLRDEILSFLEVPSRPLEAASGNPLVLMVVGVNGVGKTTTIGKLAHRFVAQGKRVLLVAADTFRAAAVEQIEIWGERVGADVVGQKGKADPSAVVYDGIQAAISRKADVVIIDTAGRLHTKVNLMEQLKKIRRTIARLIPDGPHETWLVLDATTGQNAILQAQLFHEALEITGIVLTKLDGTAKGGIVVGISHTLKLPIQYVGLGEKADDLENFDGEAFVKALF
jgi:fused signal recognition particle receptor